MGSLLATSLNILSASNLRAYIVYQSHFIGSCAFGIRVWCVARLVGTVSVLRILLAFQGFFCAASYV